MRAPFERWTRGATGNCRLLERSAHDVEHRWMTTTCGLAVRLALPDDPGQEELEEPEPPLCYRRSRSFVRAG
jgi:hypothetical protein